ncbi:MAG TPA: glycosyltransferase family 2 protein [Spirochaetota bacterium]|nr:glycosyltransferase family 2 protein [Spirochaetota bacterium]
MAVKQTSTYLSIVLPVYNEEENINLQYKRIVDTVSPLKKNFEMVFVDDGSMDRSFELLSDLAKKDKRVKIVRFRRNFGQTAAMAAGIDYSSGKVIVFMDSDLQNEPADIKKLLDKIEEGYDVVSGWRFHRKDKLISRKIPSRIANKIISKVTGVSLHDLGCSLKAYRSDVLKKVKLYGEMHRFIPIHASMVGAKIIEIPVGHHPRQFGQSKYGIKRTFKVMLDLMTVKFLSSFSTKPIYLYGGVGLFMFFLSFTCGTATILMKYFSGYYMTGNPFLLLTVMFFILGGVMILMGIQSEILIRIYHEAQNVRPYHVRGLTNIKVPKDSYGI